jgi:hypothetical protein
MLSRKVRCGALEGELPPLQAKEKVKAERSANARAKRERMLLGEFVICRFFLRLFRFAFKARYKIFAAVRAALEARRQSLKEESTSPLT